ncbi:hypothetical protein [Sphingobacterium hungaricum]|uniref:Uncharacterized protein n=1 Tax=Sphingobacterium hungaricum TaxID=2082723 RepID=A0A928YNQ9_9SPHI|nr:hypothetical protein [Sphingobacterium hungaricum]MBE8712316.1 hypothetical protein [Sphingobacterium hungaricum]
MKPTKSTPKTVHVQDSMQKNYSYTLVEPMGKNFHEEFKPDLTPQDMLELGVFAGRYLRDCRDEFPAEWYENAKLYTGTDKKGDCKLNFFEVCASQSLDEWKRKGWIHDQDPRGWFQWYCRYFMGRRTEDDLRQIKRWKNMKRHVSQVRNKCNPGDFKCNTRQRQALLHWAYDSLNM